MGLEKGELKKMDIYDQAIEKYGVTNQLIKTLGEMAELGVEINKAIEGRGVREALVSEMADVYNMLRQVARAYRISPEVLWAEMRRKMVIALGEDLEECVLCVYEEPADCGTCKFGGGAKNG